MHAEFRAALESGDVALLRKASAKAFPGAPQPESYEQAEMAMHSARTQAASIAFKARAYSHRWLSERGLPSQLPDELRPKAERLYPTIVEAVLVAVIPGDEAMRPIAKLIERAQCDAVEDAYAHKRTDPAFVRERMAEARTRTLRELIGKTGD